MEYRELSDPPDWDARIGGYATKTLFHERAWLDHVLDIHPDGRIRYFELCEENTVIGLACTLEVRRFGLKVWGSPLPGTGTNYMGPLVTDAARMTDAVRAWTRLARRHGIAHLELSNPALDAVDLSPLGFTPRSDFTHMVPLGTTEQAWDGMKSACRNRVRKAEQNGLVAEIATDPAIADEFFEQFIEVYGKQGMAVPFTVERPRSLFRRLAPAGRLLAVRIRTDDHVAATGLFPFDERCIYYWGGASWLADHHLCPNELLHWTVMQHAIGLGIPRYNMCGGTSQFKDKFGGADRTYTMHMRSAHPLLGIGREAIRRWHWIRLRLKGPGRGATR